MFNEGLYSDTFVHSRLTQQKLMMRRLMIAACVILPVIGILFFRSIIVTFLAVVIDIVMIYFLPNKNIDYEYVFVDGQIDFDRIIAGNSRKNMRRADLENVEIVAPENSHSLDSFRKLALEDYSSRADEDKHYIMVAQGDKGNFQIRFTPDEKLLEQMRMKARSKIEL